MCVREVQLKLICGPWNWQLARADPPHSIRRHRHWFRGWIYAPTEWFFEVSESISEMLGSNRVGYLRHRQIGFGQSVKCCQIEGFLSQWKGWGDSGLGWGDSGRIGVFEGIFPIVRLWSVDPRLQFQWRGGRVSSIQHCLMEEVFVSRHHCVCYLYWNISKTIVRHICSSRKVGHIFKCIPKITLDKTKQKLCWLNTWI